MPLSNRSDEGADPWVVEVLQERYRIPFRRVPTLSREPIPFSAYCPNSIRGKALEQEVESLLQKGAIELAPLPSLGYYSRLFVVMKASGSWRLVIDLSRLNLKVLKTPFQMETIQSTLLSVRRGDWMVFIDLKDAYWHTKPVHLISPHFNYPTHTLKIFSHSTSGNTLLPVTYIWHLHAGSRGTTPIHLQFSICRRPGRTPRRHSLRPYHTVFNHRLRSFGFTRVFRSYCFGFVIRLH